MSRPQLCFCDHIFSLPPTTTFQPENQVKKNTETVYLSLEEFEAFRLRHMERLEQEAAAKRMHATVSTYQRILSSASSKIADFLSNSKKLEITKH